MRICSPALRINPESNSGGECLERAIVSRLADAHDLHLILPSGAMAPDVAPHAMDWVRPRRGLRWPLTWPVYARAILRCAKRHGRPDLIRCHSARYLGPAALWAGRRLGVPVAIHHQHFDGYSWEAIDRWALQRADLVVTLSQFSADQLVRAGIPPTRIRIVPPGVGEEFWAGSQPEGHSVLFLGALKPRKNPLALADILAHLLVRVPDAFLLVAGDGPLRSALERKAAKISGRMVFLGRPKDAERPALYRSARAFVFPSRMEGFGMPVLEAMACGTPAVCSGAGALEEFRDGGAIRMETPHYVAGQLAGLLTDRAQWEWRRAEGLAFAERFRWPAVMAKLNAAYAEIA